MVLFFSLLHAFVYSVVGIATATPGTGLRLRVQSFEQFNHGPHPTAD